MKKSIYVFVPYAAACLFAGPLYSDNSERDADLAEFGNYGVTQDEQFGRNRSRGRTYTFRGRVSTGYNMDKGKAMYDLGGVIGAPAFHYTFAYEPDRAEASPILEDTDESRLVATGVDPGFYIGLGIDPSVINPDVLNIPYRSMPFTIDGNTAYAEALVKITGDNYKTDFTYSDPAKPITIRDWYSARGIASIHCFSSGEADTKFTFRNLIPNGVYAVWTIIGEDKDGNGVRDFFSPKAFGGAPNIFSADGEGKAVFERTVPYCPSTDGDTMSVEISYHVDGATYGAVPSISPLVSNGNSYVSAPVQMAFNVGGLKEAEN